MEMFSQCMADLKGRLSRVDCRHTFLVILLAVLLALGYIFHQSQYVRPQPQIYLNQSRNASVRSAAPPTKMIVVSHYREDLSWLDIFISDRIPHIVYTRSADPLVRYGFAVNKGREAVVYLRYIVDHYSALPSMIAFIHGHRTAWHQTDPSDVVVALRALRWNKHSFMPLTGTLTYALFEETGVDQQSRVNYQLWTAVMQKELGPPPRAGVKGHCCATFAVSREAILKHPKAFYAGILDYIMASAHSDALTGRTLEYTWHVIFGQPNVVHFKPCDVFFCDDTGTISVQEAEKTAASRA